MPKRRLHHRAIAFMQFSGETGKSTLTANLMAVARQVYGWVSICVDLDSNASLTALTLGEHEPGATVVQALERVASQESIEDLLTPLPHLDGYLLCGSLDGIPRQHMHWIPELIHQLKQCPVDTEQGRRPVDCVFVDPPSQNPELNWSLLFGVDYVAMPQILDPHDMNPELVTIDWSNQAQQKRGGWPVFLGLIPNRVSKKSPAQPDWLDALLNSGKLLPHIPFSERLRSPFPPQAAQGGRPVIQAAPRSLAARQLIKLWEALNDPAGPQPAAADELRQFLHPTRLPSTEGTNYA